MIFFQLHSMVIMIKPLNASLSTAKLFVYLLLRLLFSYKNNRFNVAYIINGIQLKFTLSMYIKLQKKTLVNSIAFMLILLSLEFLECKYFILRFCKSIWSTIMKGDAAYN